MLLTLQQFIANEAGKSASYDGLTADKGQCEQLVCVYWEQVCGFKCPMIADAFMLWTNPTILANFDQVPVGDEQPGDVAVFAASNLIDSPYAGHTDIYVKKLSATTWQGFDSNWGGYNVNGFPAAHLVTHTNTDVIGFLRKKGTATAPKGDEMSVQDKRETRRIAYLLYLERGIKPSEYTLSDKATSADEIYKEVAGSNEAFDVWQANAKKLGLTVTSDQIHAWQKDYQGAAPGMTLLRMKG